MRDNTKWYKELYDAVYTRGAYHTETNSPPLEKKHATNIVEYIKHCYPGSRVLDIGCSRGWALSQLKEAGCSVGGVDISTTAVEAAQAKGLDVRLASGTAIPWPDGEFDVVMSTDVFEHFLPEDVDKLIDESLRVCKPGGSLLLKICDLPCGGRSYLVRAGIIKKFPALHVTVQKRPWWEKKYTDRGYEVRDPDLGYDTFEVLR